MKVSLCDICGSIAQARVEAMDRLGEISDTMKEESPSWWKRLFGVEARIEPIAAPLRALPGDLIKHLDICYPCLRKFQTWVSQRISACKAGPTDQQ